MPNHIKNILQIEGSEDQIKEIFNKFNTHHPSELNKAFDGTIICKTNDNNVGWFNEKTGVFKRINEEDIQGIPEGYVKEMTEAYDQFPDFEKIIPMPTSVKKTIGDSGVNPKWYSWCCDNWGTKWNSYGVSKESESVYTFETAWSGVPKLIEIISKQFPNVELTYEYSDEDTGCNTGVFKFKNGLISEYYPENGSKEAYDLAFKHRPEYKEDYDLVNGNYEYKED